jgi:hypothetical protein
VTVAVSSAAEVGANLICVVHELGTDPVQVLELMVKSALPLMPTLEKVVAPPELVTPIVKLVFALTVTLPKARLDGPKVSEGWVPEPLTPTVWGLPVASSV